MSEHSPQQSPSIPRLRDLAKEACNKHRDQAKAIKMVLNRLNAEPFLRDALLEDMIRDAIQASVYSVRAKNLAALKYRETDRDIESIASVAGTFRKAFLDNWTMPDGRTLGEYTGDELKPEIEYNESLAGELHRKAEFYGKLATLAGGRTVRQAIGNDKAERVWNELLK